MRNLVALLVVSLAVAGAATPLWALTDSESVAISAVMPLRAELAIARDGGSVGRGSPATVLFDKYDDQDGQPDGSPLFMYAPYRSEAGKNWHVVKVIANGSTMTLTADVTGTAGAKPLAEILDVFTSGFFEPFPPPNFKGGASTDWELLDTFERKFDEPLTASAPMSFRLRLRGVVAGTHAGTITYTLVSTL